MCLAAQVATRSSACGKPPGCGWANARGDDVTEVACGQCVDNVEIHVSDDHRCCGNGLRIHEDENEHAAVKPHRGSITAFHVRHTLIQKLRHLSGEAGFGLSPESEQDHVVTTENGALQVGNHRVFEAVYAGENRLPCFDLHFLMKIQLFGDFR